MRGELEVFIRWVLATQADATWEIVSTIQAQFPDLYPENTVAHLVAGNEEPLVTKVCLSKKEKIGGT